MRVSSSSSVRTAFVRFTGESDRTLDRYGHSYFRDAPSVSSDVVMVLRKDLDPGPDGRPLVHEGLKFYEIPTGYPKPPAEPAR